MHGTSQKLGSSRHSVPNRAASLATDSRAAGAAPSGEEPAVLQPGPVQEQRSALRFTTLAKQAVHVWPGGGFKSMELLWQQKLSPALTAVPLIHLTLSLSPCSTIFHLLVQHHRPDLQPDCRWKYPLPINYAASCSNSGLCRNSLL